MVRDNQQESSKGEQLHLGEQPFAPTSGEPFVPTSGRTTVRPYVIPNS
ncbi:MAG: hypothetical protein SAK29_28690 [Scytonema sp. PMC 1069.18]|nr:hypothetical protein [Scytonema sp. PMC 1069.18]MEC4886578.1 hypothetical protein [Scytonema sp. PMC 1070.18]